MKVFVSREPGPIIDIRILYLVDQSGRGIEETRADLRVRLPGGKLSSRGAHAMSSSSMPTQRFTMPTFEKDSTTVPPRVRCI